MPDNILDTLISQSLKSGAKQAEAFYCRNMQLSSAVRLGKTETTERSDSAALSLRVMDGGKQAVVSTSTINEKEFPALIERAVAMMRVSPADEHAALARKELCQGEVGDLEVFDEKEPDIETLRAAALEVEDAARSVAGISNSEGGEASYANTEVTLVTSEGVSKTHQASSSSISVSVLAEKEGAMERDYDYSVARFAADLKSPKEIGGSAAERTLKRLGATKGKTGHYPVLFDKRVARSLVSYLLSAINGQSIARGTSFLQNAMNQKIFPENVTLRDDPLIKRGLSSRPFDAEAVTSAPLILVENGVLKNWLLETRSANQLGLESNGRASRGIGSLPAPASTNVVLEKSDMSLAEMVDELKDGLLVTEAFGTGVNLITGDYSQGVSGFWVENGEITRPVSEMTIAGSLSDMFASMRFADDIENESSLHIPSVLVDKMAVA